MARFRPEAVQVVGDFVASLAITVLLGPHVGSRADYDPRNTGNPRIGAVARPLSRARQCAGCPRTGDYGDTVRCHLGSDLGRSGPGLLVCPAAFGAPRGGCWLRLFFSTLLF